MHRYDLAHVRDRKKWPLESVALRLQHEKVYRRDCEECETKARKIDSIGLELELRGPLEESQRRRLGVSALILEEWAGGDR